MMRATHLLLLCQAARSLRAPPRPVTRCGPVGAQPFSDELPDLAPQLCDALTARSIVSATPIQAVALKPLRDGASAVLAAETGSGKTLAFLVPTLQRALEADASILVLAPTRELATQLAADAASLVGDAVQLIVVGAATTGEALKAARVLVATPKEAKQAFETVAILAEKATQFSAIILDEVDALLPPQKTDRRSKFSKERAKAQGKKQRLKPPPPQPAADVVEFCINANPNPALQVVAASATASRATRDALRKALRNDPYGRWSETEIEVLRGAASSQENARSVVVPSSVTHRYAIVEKNAALKIVAKRVDDVLAALQPRSALIFLAASSGHTVADTVKALRACDIAAEPLHEALQLDKQSRRDRPEGPAALGDVLGGRADASEAFTAALSSDNRPVLVTFEDSARGLHFDGVDVVIAVGLPASASSYLHVAGRTGRRLGEEVAPGTVVTMLHPKAVGSLESWANQLGKVAFEELVT